MRDIRYRAKVLNSNSWIYRQPFHIRGTWYMYNSLWDKTPIDYHTLCEYTGLEDKHGKEIYEGDVVKFRHSTDREYDSIGNVEYKQCWCGFYFGSRMLNSNMNIEVIGNIFDNPELAGDNQ